ncbi:MAG: hypothetical protein ACR2IA_10455 [Pyrinomonadaceae bacterium]
MMRRNLHGIVDGDGIKRGEFTELGVTILAPLFVGKVIAPTSLTELNLTFQLRNGNAAKIGLNNVQIEIIIIPPYAKKLFKLQIKRKNHFARFRIDANLFAYESI